MRVSALLRVEWVVVTIVAVVFYHLTGASWLLFLLLVLAPDLSMLGYLAGPKVGAVCYNLFHILVWPALLIGLGGWFANASLLAVGLIWLVHIAADRALGYGLKLSTGFQDTHLGRIGGG